MADDKHKITPPPLDSEAATRQGDPWAPGFMGQVVTNDPLLLERGEPGSRAFELYRDLMRDGKVFAGMQKRKLAVVSRSWTVAPQVDTPAGRADAKIVSDILSGFAFDRLCAGLLNAVVIGWQPAEVVWTLRGLALEGGGVRQMVVPDRTPTRLHRRFIYRDAQPGQPAQLRLLTRDAMQDGVPVDARKFLVHVVEPEDGNPYGSGLGLQLYWPVFFKRKGVLAWNKLCDRFGTPTPWGQYPREASPREKGTLFEALRAFSNDGFMMTPEGTMIQLLESKLSAGGQTPNQSLVEYMDDWINEVLLGQPPRAQGGGALAAAANEREGVRLELSQADSDLLCETLNRTLIRWICELNGLQPCLVYRKIDKEADTRAMSETDRNVAQLGFRPSAEYIRERYGEGWEPDPTPRPLSATSHPVADNKNPASFAEDDPASGPSDQVALDAALDAVPPEVLQAHMERLLAPVMERLQADGDPQALLGWLAERFPTLDESTLQEHLARLLFAAQVWGRIHGQID